MANFIGLVYGTLKQKGIDTSKMSTEEAIEKYNELNKNDTTDKLSSTNKEVKEELNNINNVQQNNYIKKIIYRQKK